MILISESKAQNIQQGHILRGIVLSEETKIPLSGVTVSVKSNNSNVFTDSLGSFAIESKSSDSIVTVSFIGYETREVNVISKDRVIIYLKKQVIKLDDVVVSTGYQKLSEQNTTGSFVQVDNELLNRRVGGNVLDRLEDITPGLVFNKGRGGFNSISIRGVSTLFANSDPLIVLDNFPYEGDIDDINPNDIESITILKDAASAAIWGSRAGNGVIVIQTKKGEYGKATKVTFNSNLTIAQKDNLFYKSVMPVSDFIEMEKYLFEQGYYNSTEQSASKTALTPVVEWLIAQRDKKIPADVAHENIELLKGNDVRDDLLKYYYQNPVSQQYSLSINGGSDKQVFYITAGFDENKLYLKGNKNDRISFRANHSYGVIKNKLEFSSGISYVNRNVHKNNPGTNISLSSGVNIYPYAQFTDSQGNHLAITRDFRDRFKNDAMSDGLLDWNYVPLDEFETMDNSSNNNSIHFNTGLKYKLSSSIGLEFKYQFDKNVSELKDLNSLESYFTRNLINQYTQIDDGGNLEFGIPMGDILNYRNSKGTIHNIRTQTDYNKVLNEKHFLNAIIGWEIRDSDYGDHYYRTYGYNDSRATMVPIDNLSRFPMYQNPALKNLIPFVNQMNSETDRFWSLYSNFVYSYERRYLLSMSLRKDESNLFGVKSNKKGIPLWSIGSAWTISNERFYNYEWLPYLRLSFTYGHSGNIDRTLSAVTAATRRSSSYYVNLPTAEIVNPPNPHLRWEKVNTINFAIDFQTKNGFLDAKIEHYHKNGSDLIGNTPFAPSTGISQFKGNVSAVKTRGTDVIINTKNINSQIKWSSSLLLNYVKSIVSDYKIDIPATTILTWSDSYTIYPIEGYPLLSVFSLPWAGLDPENGNPQGYLNGEVSKDYQKLVNPGSINELVYHGPGLPTYSGAFRNTFSWRQWSMSLNVSYRFGHYFRDESVNYSSVLTGKGGHGDFVNRWKNPGDEGITHVPSIPEKTNSQRDRFYTYSEILIHKGDNIRLQDIRFSYTGKKSIYDRIPLNQIEFYLYINNIGRIWKSSKISIDPDYPFTAPVKSISIGMKLNI